MTVRGSLLRYNEGDQSVNHCSNNSIRYNNTNNSIRYNNTNSSIRYNNTNNSIRWDEKEEKT